MRYHRYDGPSAPGRAGGAPATAVARSADGRPPRRGRGPRASDADEALMLRAGAGDREACQRLVERHLRRVLAQAQRALGNRSDAEDAVQDVFLRLWSAAPRWRDGGAPFTCWLRRVARNVCLDRIGKTREACADDVPEAVDERPEPSLAVHIMERRRHVAAALARVPDAQRLALTLCYLQGLRNREAAAAMRVSVEALESLLARGRRALRLHLREVLEAMPTMA